LIWPALAARTQAGLPTKHVLVLGGGDGLAVREILKYPGVREVVLVDLDPEMTRLFTTHPRLTALNGGSLRDRRVRVVNDDAFVWLAAHPDVFDFVVVDFPDPSNYAVGKLYTVAFYQLLARHVSRDGLAVVQSTSPLFARQSYWSIVATIAQAGLGTHPYHLYVPTFGEWGFVLASTGAGGMRYAPPTTLPAGLRYLTTREIPQLFDFAPDMQPVSVRVNRLNDQALVRYYEDEWSRINR
jgi:spermidine synthase